MTLSAEIINNWETDIPGYVQTISSLENTSFPAWTIKTDEGYGVAIQYDGRDTVNETFSAVRIASKKVMFEGRDTKTALVLITARKEIQSSFAALCAAFIEPGINGGNRNRIITDPILWWKEWKELLGNRNIDSRIYDVLGELCVFKYALGTGQDAEWNGPDGATYDIETRERFLEVKSSTNRFRKEVTISSQFQLFPPQKPLELVLCIFEPVIMSGCSIDSIVSDLEALGYNTDIVNTKLAAKGFEQGMSSRKMRFLLHEMLLYKIDDSFPRITPASFPGGVLPEGITKITYTVDLSGITPITLIKDTKDEI